MQSKPIFAATLSLTTGFSSWPKAPGIITMSLAGSQRVQSARSTSSASKMLTSLFTTVTICKSKNAAKAAMMAFFASPFDGGSIWSTT